MDNNEGVEHIVGMHGIGERNDNGNMFTEFCADYDLIIGGTWCPHKRHHKVTWVSPDKQTENQIDHFAIKRSWRKSLLDVRSKRGADVGSDHHLVVAQLRIKILAAKRKFETRRKNFDTRKIKERIVKDKIKLELRNKFQVLMEQETENTGNIETSWNEIKEGLLKISEQTLGYKHKRKKDWVTTETWEVIELRGRLKQHINASKTRNQKSILTNEYNAINKEVKRLARRDKRKWINEMANKAEEAANKGDLKTLYQTMKILSKKMSTVNYSIRNKDDVLLTGEGDQIIRWKQYFEEILNKENNETDNASQEEDEEITYVHAGINVDPPNLKKLK